MGCDSYNCILDSKTHTHAETCSKKQFLKSVKGRNSVANLQKMTFYNSYVYLVNANDGGVYKIWLKFCPFIHKIIS